MIVSQQNTPHSDPPGIGTAKLQAQAGSLHLNALTEIGDITKIDGYLHNLLEGYLGDFKQSFISESRREIRGWVAESMQSGFSSVTDAMASEMRALLSEDDNRSRSGTAVEVMDPITRSDDQTEMRSLTAEFRDQRWSASRNQSASFSRQRSADNDQILDTFVIHRSTPLGLMILRIRRGGRWQRVEFTFHPIRFISRGMDVAFELHSDARGYPLFRGGELYTYGIIHMESPILKIINSGDIGGLRNALQSKDIAISDRGQAGLSLLHVSQQRCFLSMKMNARTEKYQFAVNFRSQLMVEELVNNGIDLEVLDKYVAEHFTSLACRIDR